MSAKAHLLRPKPGTPPRAPEAVRNGNVVIVGAGPTGLLAALLLHERGVKTTIIERSEDDGVFDVTRAYPVSLIKRGATILDGVPGLREAVQEKCITPGLDSAYQIRADGSLGPFWGSYAMDKELFGLRSSYVEPLKERAMKTDGITLMFGAELIDMTFGNDRTIELELIYKGATKHLTSQLVLGCDGRSSKTLRLLRKAAGEGQLKSRHGFGEISMEAAASSRQRKTLLMDTSVEDLLPKEMSADKKLESSIVMMPAEGVPADRALLLVVIPMVKSYMAQCGGRMTSVIKPPEHEIWKAQTVDEAYALFRENFPKQDVEKLIPRENLQKFIEAEPRSYGMVRRSHSLVGTAGGAGAGGCGVVLLGDAAHSFPPIMALGLNSSFEDIGVLMRLLDDASSGDNSAAVARRYERARLEDIKALIEINARTTVAGRRKVRPLMQMARFVDWMVRTPLAKRWPEVFDVSERKMILADAPFSEVMKKKRETRRRAVLVLAGVIATVGSVVGKVASA